MPYNNQEINNLPYNEILKPEIHGVISGKVIYVPLSDEKYHLIVNLLSHKKAIVRWRAADLLGKLQEIRAVPVLIDSLPDWSWLVRLHAAKALGRIGDQAAVPALIARINDPCPYVRRRVARALSRFNTSEARQGLARLIVDKDPKVAQAATSGLNYSKDKLIFPLLLRALKTEEIHTVFIASQILSQFGRDASILVPDLEILLDKMYNPKNRFRLIGVLGKIGTRRARKVLRKYTIDPDGGVSRRAKAVLAYPKRKK